MAKGGQRWQWLQEGCLRAGQGDEVGIWGHLGLPFYSAPSRPDPRGQVGVAQTEAGGEGQGV